MIGNGGDAAACRNFQPSSPPALRDRLRAATRDLHERIDSQFGKFDLSTLHGYRGFLEASAAALLPLENALADAGIERLFPDWTLRARSTAILDDLEQLGGVCWLMPTPEPLDFGGMLGTMYVLEGSRLGARMLLRTVARSPDRAVIRATAYLSHGERQPLWQTFLGALERHAENLDDPESAIGAAHRAFDLFDRAARLVTNDRNAFASPLPAQA